METPALKARNAAMEHFVSDPVLLNDVMNLLYHRKTRLGSIENLPTRREVRSIIAHGVLRAWLYAFLDERGIDRRDLFSKSRDKNQDYEVVLESYPDLDNFIPKASIEPLVRTAVGEEAELTLRGRGSDWHQTVAEEDQPYLPLPSACLSYVEGMSPIIIRVASYLVAQFGMTATAYWVYCRYVFDGEYANAIRALGPKGLEHTDPARFKALQVDLRRKMAIMDEAVKELRSDPVLQDAYAAMGEE